MRNAELFEAVFGIYATELWAKPEAEFLKWLNADSPDYPGDDMTVDEAIYCMRSYLPDSSYEHCINCRYYSNTQASPGENIRICKSSVAHRMAIEALKKSKQ